MLLDGQAVENGFYIFRINIFPALGDDHVLLAAEQLQMAVAIEAAQIAGQEPAIDNRLQGEFGIVEIVGHESLAAGRDFSNAFVVRIQNAQLDSGKRLTDCVGAKRSQIVERKSCARLGETITVHNRNTEVVEKLHGRGFHECAARDQGQQLAAKGAVHTGKQHAAELDLWTAARQKLVGRDHAVENRAFPPRQLAELGAQAALQVLYDHRNQRDISDAIAHKRVADKFGTQGAQVDHTCAANKW